MSLIDTYEKLKAAEAENEVVSYRKEILSKYASVAAELLEKEYPSNWTVEEQAKLAEELIAMDMEEEEKIAHVQELQETSRIMAREMWDEWTKLASEK